MDQSISACNLHNLRRLANYAESTRINRPCIEG